MALIKVIQEINQLEFPLVTRSCLRVLSTDFSLASQITWCLTCMLLTYFIAVLVATAVNISLDVKGNQGKTRHALPNPEC